MAVDVYHVERGPSHGYGSRDRDQSRDWCAFAANGIGLDQTVPAESRQRSPFWLQRRHGAARDIQARVTGSTRAPSLQTLVFDECMCAKKSFTRELNQPLSNQSSPRMGLGV